VIGLAVGAERDRVDGFGQQFCFAREQASLLVTGLLPRLT
jgi:hypothetical protein